MEIVQVDGSRDAVVGEDGAVGGIGGDPNFDFDVAGAGHSVGVKVRIEVAGEAGQDKITGGDIFAVANLGVTIGNGPAIWDGSCDAFPTHLESTALVIVQVDIAIEGWITGIAVKRRVHDFHGILLGREGQAAEKQDDWDEVFHRATVSDTIKYIFPRDFENAVLGVGRGKNALL